MALIVEILFALVLLIEGYQLVFSDDDQASENTKTEKQKEAEKLINKLDDR